MSVLKKGHVRFARSPYFSELVDSKNKSPGPIIHGGPKSIFKKAKKSRFTKFKPSTTDKLTEEECRYIENTLIFLALDTDKIKGFLYS